MERITQSRLDELRISVPHASLADIGAETKPGIDPNIVEDIQKYLRHFAALKRDTDGKAADGQPCIVCDQPLVGMAAMLVGRGGFQWGLAHGEGFCGNCRWLATVYHFVKDRDGNDLMTFRHVILQVHPDQIEITP